MMHLDPHTGEHWLADSYRDLRGWAILEDFPWKPGVRRISIATENDFGGAEYRMVYVRATENDSRMYRTQETVEALMDAARESCAEHLEATMSDCLREIHKQHFPKRTIKLIEGMGCSALYVDDKDIDSVVNTVDRWRGEDSIPAGLVELQELMEWYSKVSSHPNTELGEIVIRPEQ